MASYHCSVCSLDYPVNVAYSDCLECGLRTRYAMSRKAMPPEKLAALKKANEPPSEDDVTKRRTEAEHRFETFYEYAIREASRRNEIGGEWTPEDILVELLDQQAA